MYRILDLLPHGIYKRIFCDNNEERKYELIDEPVLFNADGSRRRVFYLQDTLSGVHPSFSAGREGKSILWDRSNYTLPIHFYAQEQIMKTKPIADKKFALLMEPEVFSSAPYEYLYQNPQTAAEFDSIYTFSDRLLDKYSNARLFFSQGAWYGTSVGGGEKDPLVYQKKTKNVSMVSSGKTVLESHRLRNYIASELKKDGYVDTYGGFDGGRSIKIAEALTDYRFSVALENEISSYYFTEKILNCFAAMTIPVYAGATKIGDFFNIDGIVVIDKYAPIEDIIKTIRQVCTKEYYEEHLDAVIDNFHRAERMECMEDCLYEMYSTSF